MRFSVSAASRILAALALVIAGAAAQTTSAYDSLLSGTQWYVPSSSLLGYESLGSFSTNFPVSSQNVFNITSCVNGELVGTNNITTVLGTNPPTYTLSYFTGQITESGGLTLQMGTANSSRLMYWHGQILTLASGQLQLQIQMMSSGGAVYLNHWMYMNQSTASTVLPENSVSDEFTNYNNQSANFRWLLGTNWTLNYPALFPSSQSATFFITGFYNGYFWGSGVSLASTGVESSSFTLFASVVPEGRLLFDILLSDGTMSILWGNVTYSLDNSGSPSYGYMAMQNCSTDTVTGPFASATLQSIFSGRDDDDDNSDDGLAIGLSVGLVMAFGMGVVAAYYYISRAPRKPPMAQAFPTEV